MKLKMNNFLFIIIDNLCMIIHFYKRFIFYSNHLMWTNYIKTFISSLLPLIWAILNVSLLLLQGFELIYN